LVLLLEGAEGLRKEDDLDEYYDRGLRIVGPVGKAAVGAADLSPDSMRFTPEGKRFLEILSSKGFILDVAHMNTFSADEALDLYEGTVIASHCNCRRLLRSPENQRHFDDETIRKLIDRDGVMGVIPFNNFLDTDWKNGMPRNRVTWIF
jgi:membrane dipeptidase